MRVLFPCVKRPKCETNYLHRLVSRRRTKWDIPVLLHIILHFLAHDRRQVSVHYDVLTNCTRNLPSPGNNVKQFSRFTRPSFYPFLKLIKWKDKFQLTALLLGRDSSFGIATTLRAGRSGDRIPVGGVWTGENFLTRPHRPCGPISLLYNGYRVFPGCKAAAAWRWPPTPK
jgi:hypothetical protein